MWSQSLGFIPLMQVRIIPERKRKLFHVQSQQLQRCKYAKLRSQGAIPFREVYSN
jgi:hypothetical protein